MSGSPRPQKRTAHTCVTCRARKVRCDGRRGICTNCERLGFGCSYDETVGVEVAEAVAGTGSTVGGSGHAGTINVPRRRVRQACLSCHAKKARCSGAVPRCDRCRAQGLGCVYRPGKRTAALPTVAAGASDEAGADVVMAEDASSFDMVTASTTSVGSPVAELPAPEEGMDSLTTRTFDTYFRVVHHIPGFSFLHQASLMERHNMAGGLDRCLLLAMIGIASHMKDLGPGMQEYGDRCVNEAETICLSELEKPSIITLQALVLVIKHRVLSRRTPSAFMLFATASRLASALRLNHENGNLCFLARESRRRLMWAMYLIDAAMANGQPDFALWPDAERRIHVQLPCNERNFEFDLPEATEMLRPPALVPSGSPSSFPDDLGFLALHTRVHWMHARILEYSAKLMSRPTPEEIAYIPAAVAGTVAELEAFGTRLPVSFRWSESNVRLRTYSPRLTVYIMTHIWARQCLLSLHRLFLPGLKEALPHATLAQLDAGFVSRARHQCYEHARAMADMFATLLALDNGVPTTDLDLPSSALQCARVLYHAHQTAGDALGFSAERVRELATVCLRVAQQSTPGQACASIQRDIEKVIATGLPLAAPQGLTPATPLPTRGTETGSSGSMAYMMPKPTATVTAAAAGGMLAPTGLTFGSLAGPGPDAISPFVPPPTPVAAGAAPDLLAAGGGLPLAPDLLASAQLGVLPPPSHTTEKTSASNAFEGALYDLNFGPDFLGGADALLGFGSNDLWFSAPGLMPGPEPGPGPGPAWNGGAG